MTGQQLKLQGMGRAAEVGRRVWPKGPQGKTMEERFWEKVVKTESCWIWTGFLTTRGYGTFHVSYKPQLFSSGYTCRAHRMAWQLTNGIIPKGLQLDHLCRNTRCCNPAHLEPVTAKINTLRGIGPTAINARTESCKIGHPLSGNNLMICRRGEGAYYRRCRICLCNWKKDWRRQREEAGLPRM